MAVKDKLLNCGSFRKAIAIHSIAHFILERNMRKSDLGRALGVKPGVVQHWCYDAPKYRSKRPKQEQIEDVASALEVSVEQLIDYVVDDDRILSAIEKDEKTQKAINDYKKERNKTEHPTHDDSKDHMNNLSRFADSEYDLYYLHRTVEDEDTIEKMVIRTGKISKSGVVKCEMQQTSRENSNPYTGNITAFPGLTWACLYFMKKGSYHPMDVGLAILNYPEDDITDDEYICGSGIMMSVDRNQRNSLLVQRVVMIRRNRDNRDVPQSIMDLIESNLKTRIDSKDSYLLSIADVPRLHGVLYKGITGIK